MTSVPLSPQARAIVTAFRATFPDLGGAVTDATEARRVLAAAARRPATPLAVARVVDDEAPGPDGPVPVRCYWPPTPGADPGGSAAGSGGPPPLVVHHHGGGFVLGDLDGADALARQLAVGLGAVVVSVGYRLAPEHPFPAAVVDAFAATAWAAGRATELGADPGAVVVTGDSAGGGLAAAVALLARERGRPDLALQLLWYPVLDARRDTPSHAEHGPDLLLTPAHMAWFWARYLADPADGADPLASPLRAADLAGLPPAVVVTAGHDPLRDEGAAYARRLAEAGVAVAHHHHPDLFHGFASMGPVLAEAGDAHRRALAAARSLLGASARREGEGEGPAGGPSSEERSP